MSSFRQHRTLHTHIPTDSKHYHFLGRMADCCRPSPHSGLPETQYGCKSVRATRRRVEPPPSASGIRRYGRSRKGGASMPGRERCPMQTGRGLCMRGDQRGRGTQLEYDRKGKYSLSLERQLCNKYRYFPTLLILCPKVSCFCVGHK